MVAQLMQSQQAQLDPLFTSQHFLMILTPMIPFVLFWWDTRRQNKRMHDETQRQNWTMHTENQNRLATIETKLDPMWAWWTGSKGGD